VNPHHFRHSRATQLANWLTEAQLCAWFGWVQGRVSLHGMFISLDAISTQRILL
jgi:hypothetical protein